MNQVECIGIFFDAGLEVHAEDGADHRGEGDPKRGDLHVQVHANDPVPGLVLMKQNIQICQDVTAMVTDYVM